jgi:hypothetical protein
MIPIPWKLVLIGLSALLVLALVAGGYLYVSKIQNDLIGAKTALTREQSLRSEAEARADQIQLQASMQTVRIDALEAQRTSIAHEVVQLRDTIRNMDIEDDIAGDNDEKADHAVATLNARNRELNRLLEHAAGDQVRPGPSSDSKASPTGPAQAVR